MAGERRIPEPSELIYVPAASWQPALIAAGLGGVLAGLFVWWPYAALGGIVALLALRAWVGEAREQFGRLPREQRTATAPLPAVPLKPGE